MTKRFVCIHGYKGNATTPPWFPWLAHELQKQCKAATSIPSMPYPESPNLEAWLRIIFRAAHELDFPETTFIGHSLGGAAILRAIEMSAEPAAHVVLVGTPIDIVGRPPLQPFYQTPWDFELLKTKAARFTCLYSKDDPAVPFAHGEEFARQLGARFVPFTDRGHFDQQSEFPELIYNLLLDNE